MNISKQLKDNEALLRLMWDKLEVQDKFAIQPVDELDMYYTDRMAEGADFKIEILLKGDKHINNAYIWPSGDLWVTTSNIIIHGIITRWIDEVKKMSATIP